MASTPLGNGLHKEPGADHSRGPEDAAKEQGTRGGRKIPFF